MKQKFFTILLFSALIILSCSSSKETTDQNNEVEVSSSVITSSNLKITIPSNWREIDDNHNRLFELWLVRNDNKAVISFIPIHLDEKIETTDENDKLSLIEKILLAKKENSDLDFNLIGKGTLPAKYSNKTISYYLGDQFQNSIIYGQNEVFYECLAYFNNNYNPEEFEIDDLVEIQQQAVIESIIK